MPATSSLSPFSCDVLINKHRRQTRTSCIMGGHRSTGHGTMKNKCCTSKCHPNFAHVDRKSNWFSTNSTRAGPKCLFVELLTQFWSAPAGVLYQYNKNRWLNCKSINNQVAWFIQRNQCGRAVAKVDKGLKCNIHVSAADNIVEFSKICNRFTVF